jgi:hypothetical protein
MSDKVHGLPAVRRTWIAFASITLPGCGSGGSEGTPGSGGSVTAPQALSSAAQLGDQLFSDTKLSASGQQACSTCHVPTHAYTAVDGLAVPLGGPGMNLPGLRNAQFEYNDLPLRFDANVNIGEVPYTPPKIGGGQAPTLTADDITAVIAFLCTLTDGYDPAHPRAYALPAQCAATGTSSSQHSSAD